MKKEASSYTIKQILSIILFLDSLAVTLAIARAVILDISPATYFGEIGRDGYITYISFLQLSIAAIFAFRIFRVAKLSPKLNQSGFFWLVVGIGLFFLALDDVVGIHEQLDYWLHDLFDLEETEITDMADDLIVGGYLAIGLIFVVSQWQAIKIFNQAFIFFRLGFVLASVMVLLDIVTSNMFFVSTITDNFTLQLAIKRWLSAIEDSTKIFAEGILIVGTYKCWQIARKS